MEEELRRMEADMQAETEREREELSRKRELLSRRAQRRKQEMQDEMSNSSVCFPKCVGS